jgi:hypothetical protein
MPVFAIIPQPNPNTPKLAGAISAHFPNDNLGLDGGKAWLVSTKGTVQELSGKLGVTSGDSGAAVIVEVASYYGRATPDIWSWIKTKMESQPSG